jgi:hypothetical protein
MIFLFSLLLNLSYFQSNIFIPVNASNRHDISAIKLTEIGDYGLMRKERKGIPAHYHTGIDILRPAGNYDNEPIFPIAEGRVISLRTDGPYANIIIEHHVADKPFWSLYEHVAGSKVHINDTVDPHKPIARFMNRDELNRYGWQFDHFHLEILKVMPRRITPSKECPERYYNSFSLICYTLSDLDKYFYNPVKFFKTGLKNDGEN